MKFADYSPPSAPSLDQQQVALRKGLGRAWQWALGGCLLDRRFTAWKLWDQPSMARSKIYRDLALAIDLRRLAPGNGSGCRSSMRCTTLPTTGAANSSFANSPDATAEAGDETFRTHLYEIVEKKPVADTPGRRRV